MAYDVTNIVTMGGLQQLATRVKTEITSLDTASDTIKYISTESNTIKFFSNAEGTGTPAFTVDFPSELFLDTLRTTFVANFTYSASTYSGASNPNLDGKPVLVLAIKDTKNTNSASDDTYNYSFLDLTSLLNIYTVNTDNGDTVSSRVLEINGYKVKFKISSTTGNKLSSDANGLFVGADDTKANKVTGSNLAGVIPQLTATGDLAASTVKVSDLVIATDAEVTEMLNGVFSKK